MMQFLPILVCLGVPLALVLFFKTSAAMLFFCVAASSLLQQFMDLDAATAANSLLPSSGVDYMSLAVLVVPLLIVAAAFSHTVKSAQLPLHSIIALCSGATILIVSTQFFPRSFLDEYVASEISKTLSEFQTVIIGVGFLLSVVTLYLTRQKHHPHKKH